jgi:hypothetical protein
MIQRASHNDHLDIVKCLILIDSIIERASINGLTYINSSIL